MSEVQRKEGSVSILAQTVTKSAGNINDNYKIKRHKIMQQICTSMSMCVLQVRPTLLLGFLYCPCIQFHFVSVLYNTVLSVCPITCTSFGIQYSLIVSFLSHFLFIICTAYCLSRRIAQGVRDGTGSVELTRETTRHGST